MARVSPTNNLKFTNPELVSQLLWVYEKDGVTRSNDTAETVSRGSAKKAEWACDKEELNHSSYSSSIGKRTCYGRGCPTCGGARIEKGINDLKTTHPEIASQLLWVYEKDGVTRSNDTVESVSKGVVRKAEWQCANKDLNHDSYKATIGDRTPPNNTGCPLCATGKTEGLFRDSFNQHSKNNFVSARIPLERANFKSGRMQVDMISDKLLLAIEYDSAYVHGSARNPKKNITTEKCLARDIESTIALIKSDRKVIRIREHSREEKLQFIKLPEEYADSLYQITYKSFGKDKTDIDELVKRIIKEKQDWFKICVTKNFLLSS